jgi:hypothetical protein
MKLLTGLLPQFRDVLAHGRWFTPSVVVLCGGLELFGRTTNSDIHDTVGSVVFLMILAGIAIRHRANPIGWVKWLGARTWFLARFGDRFKVDFGPDLRCTPPIPRGYPSAFYYLVAIFLVWGGLASLTWWALPQGWRDPVVTVSYIGYLSMMSVLWGLLFVAYLGGIYFPIMLFTRLANPGSKGEAKLNRRQLVFFTTYVVSTVTASWLLPLWPMLAFAWAFWVATLFINLLPTRPTVVQLLWRNPRTRRIRSMTMRRLILGICTLSVMLLTCLVMTAAGGNVLGHAEHTNTMRLTAFLGNCLAWLIPGLLISSAAFVYLGYRGDTARRYNPSAFLEGIPEQLEKPIAKLFERRGWEIDFDGYSPEDVRLKIVPPDRSQAKEFDPKWPLEVCVADLDDPMLFDRLIRRQEIQLRRLLLRGLEKLFDSAKGRKFNGGCGFWVAPHWWFIPGMTRDEVIGGDEEPSFLTEVIGPTYVELFSMTIRRYTFQLLRSLQVDLIFVEDGIGYKKVKRVLRSLFEIYDKSAGQKRAEDVHFAGMTNVRVMFHNFDVQEPFRPSIIYPEPRFTPVGRLRVMHIFKDRGEDELFADLPFEFNETPIPTGLKG